MPNDSSNRYSEAVSNFLTDSLYWDYYAGFGVVEVGYADKSSRVSKDVANSASFIKRVTLDNVSAVFTRNDWVAAKTFKVFDYTDPTITNSLCFNSTTKELYLCVGDTNYNKLSTRNNSAPSKFAPSGSNGTVINMEDGYSWVKVNYDPAPISSNYIKVTGIESLVDFRGSTLDATGPTGGGSTGLTFGTCCLYATESWIEPVTGKTYNAGDIVASYKVPNRWTCGYLASQLDFEGVFLPSVTSTEYGGFFNISGPSGCTPCGATYSTVTPLALFNAGGSGGYTAGNVYRQNTDILTAIPSGCILSVMFNDRSDVTYYSDIEDPEINLDTDGTIGSCKAYLKTEFVGGINRYKVIGVYLTNQLTSSNCTYVEAPSLVTGNLSIASLGSQGAPTDPSSCLASIQFNLAPISDESYLKIYDLLRTTQISVAVELSEAEINTLFNTPASYSFESAFLVTGLKNSSGYRIQSDGARSYSKAPIKASASAIITSISGDINTVEPGDFVADFSDPIDVNYLTNKTSATKTIGSGSRAFVPGKPTSSFNLGFGVFAGSTSGSVEISSYDAYAIGTGGSYTVQFSGGATSSFTVTSITGPSINMSDCTVLFTTDTLIQSENTFNLIFNI